MPFHSAVITLDLGNTLLKGALWIDGELKENVRGSVEEVMEKAGEWREAYGVNGAAVCSTSADDRGLERILREIGVEKVVRVGADTKVPIRVDYPRERLGADRLCAAVGAAEKGRAFLIADAGTALTLDVTDGLRYCGGNISPGLKMRLRSLHEHTQRLPVVEKRGATPLLGDTTDTAIRSGCLRGAAYEVAGTLEALRRERPETELILTGGDGKILARLLAGSGVEARCEHDLVHRGLLKIYNDNDTTRQIDE